MHKATADTNILVSALLFERGKPYQLLKMASEGQIELAVSDPIIAETLRILHDKFGTPADELPHYDSVIRSIATVIKPKVELKVIKEDPDDDKILECAVSAGSGYIISGDKDLLRLGYYDSIRIVTVADFLSQGREWIL